MYPIDPDGSTPSMVEQNLLIWMLEVNGLIIDVSHAPREIQEASFRQGLSDHAENTGLSPLGLAPHSLTAISDDQIDVGGSSSAQILQEANPSLFILLDAGAVS